jgi:hypothetical protein
VRVRRVGVTALVLVVLGSLVSVAASSGAPAKTPAQLLRDYSPLLVLHPDERFQPEAVDGFLTDADLVSGHYDQRLCKSVDGPAALDCYATADAAHTEPPLVYGGYFRTSARIVLEYWLFYPFDLYSVADPPNDFWQDHEGDWEAVAVVLDSSAKPLYVGTSRHCSGARRDWIRAQRRGTHPVVYVALGSHANYFAPGEIPLERKCWPQVALAIYDAYKVSLVDHVAAGKTVTPRVVRITSTTPSWMTFPGAWGETQYAHFPNNNPFAFGLGPSGPAFHALWRKPIATLLGWPRG